MNSDVILSPIYIFLAFVLYGLVHSLLASRPAKELASAFFGSADRYYRLFFNLFGTLTLLPVLALPALLPDAPLYRVPAPWLYITSGVQLIAALGLAIGLLQTGALEFLGLKQLYTKP
ncbi:MAG: hypothetical protein OEV06_06480, partial [Anaerolineae bacterium]|nr:hypothetical protein [Anaerolineae bacterium]